jgi:hypothetical protein
MLTIGTGRSALHQACQYKAEGAVEFLLNVRLVESWTRRSRELRVQECKDIVIDGLDIEERQPLHLACEVGFIKVARVPVWERSRFEPRHRPSTCCCSGARLWTPSK